MIQEYAKMTGKFLVGIISCLLVLAALGARPERVAAQPNRKQMEQAQKLIAEGDVFYRQKNYRAAIEKYNRATILAVNYPLAHYSKGYTHFNLGEYDRAIESLTTALDQGYKAEDVYDVRWRSYFLKGDLAGALADLEAAIKAAPANANFQVGAGLVYHEKGQFQEAIAAFRKAVDLGSTDPNVNYYLAKSYNRVRDFDQQGAAAEEAIRNSTKYIGESWNLVGQSRQIAGNRAGAIDAYERALIAKPDQPEVYSFLSDLYRSENRFQEAVNTTQKGIKLYPEDGNLYISLSWYYSLADKHDEAIVAAQKATKLAPNEYMGFTNLCRAYNDEKFYDLAISACQTALKLRPGDGESNLYLARAYYSKNLTTLATEHYKKAVDGLIQYTKDNPDYSDGFYLLGNAYTAVNDYDSAMAAYRKTLQLSPRFARARYNLGFLLYQTGKKAEAREQHAELQKIDPALAERLLQAINK
jgi:tetratricopeptide (TPR) repeat protein